MSIEGFDGKVLFVDDDEGMRGVLGRQADLAELDFIVLGDAESAAASIDASVGAVFSDGLEGGWREVIAAAKEARIPGVVLSGDIRIQKDVEEAGAIFLNKATIELGFIEDTLEKIVEKASKPEEAAEASATIPEVSTDGLSNVLDKAAERVVEARGLQAAAEAIEEESDDFMVAAQGLIRRKRANEEVAAVLAATSILDEVLPLPDGGTWNQEVSDRAKDMAEL